MRTGERCRTFTHPKILHQSLSQRDRTDHHKILHQSLSQKDTTTKKKVMESCWNHQLDPAQARGFKPGISIRAAVFSAGRHWWYHSLSLILDECLISIGAALEGFKRNTSCMTKVKLKPVWVGSKTLVPKTGSSCPIIRIPALCGQIWGLKMKIHHSTVPEGFSWLGWRQNSSATMLTHEYPWPMAIYAIYIHI